MDKLLDAEEILCKAGYEKNDYIKTMLNDWKWRHHHVAYVHPVKKVKLEVHWRLNPGPGKEPTFNNLWKRKSQNSLTNSVIYTLGKERSEEHTSELQSRGHLVCRLLIE